MVTALTHSLTRVCTEPRESYECGPSSARADLKLPAERGSS